MNLKEVYERTTEVFHKKQRELYSDYYNSLITQIMNYIDNDISKAHIVEDSINEIPDMYIKNLIWAELSQFYRRRVTVCF